MQKRLLPRFDLVELHQIFGKLRGIQKILACKQAVIHQFLGVNEQRIAGKGGETRIGRVAKDAASRNQGQKLPVLLLRCYQKVKKCKAAPSQGPDAARPGQGGDMHEKATASRLKDLAPANPGGNGVTLHIHATTPCLSSI